MGDALTRLHWHPPHPLQTSFVFLSRSSVDHSNASKPRRRALKVISALPAAIVLAACSKRRQPMLVASHVWPGYELMFLAQREGWLDTQLVGLVDTQSATQSMQALEARQVDAAALTLDETLILVDRGVDLRVVLVFNRSSGADAVLGKPGVGSLAEIAGKRVGVEDTAAGALMLHKMLDAAGLSANAIEVVPLTIDQHLDAWQAGMIDVLVSYEPGYRCAVETRRKPSVRQQRNTRQDSGRTRHPRRGARHTPRQTCHERAHRCAFSGAAASSAQSGGCGIPPRATPGQHWTGSASKLPWSRPARPIRQPSTA
ncbi:hypothetical protein GPA21_00695 [Azoarcus taiwanensis]|uniref:SsuA/THI5-like domain-containing protein n=1 Tax=Azoarcus taiwanensis TaxID=666964 RepID=A0A972J7E0_9RHOO|nr:hypothetical protein [Azoarcus taiwanensis]